MPVWKAWLLAARPRTLPAAVVPVLVGSALAASRNQFDGRVFAATLAVSLLLQIGANFANDVFDFLKGADAARRGPTRVTQSGFLSPRQMLWSTGVVFGLAALIGLYLVTIGGWPLLVVGALAILAALAYTGGPWPLGYHGLGDLFVFIFFGLVGVVGTFYLQTRAVTPLAFMAAIPVGLLITNILVVNNLRDIETDRAAGKRTLAVRIGADATRTQFTLFVYLAYIVPPLLALGGMAGDWFWLPWLSVPLAVRLVRDVQAARESGSSDHAPTFNRLLARTAQLNLVYGVLFAISLLAPNA
ncbi:MAG: 1,4-dihydroxy-2-naphthoate polyprenyltransferase [Chloroflexota bacterium]